MSDAHESPVRAEVISIVPNRVRVSVDDIVSFRGAAETLRVGGYIKISDNNDSSLICIIDSFSIEIRETTLGPHRYYILDAYPLGVLTSSGFRRGGDEIAIPPKAVVVATESDIEAVYRGSLDASEKFVFSSLQRRPEVNVPVNGNRFFNKHIAVVGATGSGKSNAVATIIQTATKIKSATFAGLNNSHIVIFDIHSEYASAFPNAPRLDVRNLALPYWLLNEDEIDSLFMDAGDHNNYNQDSLLKSIILSCKQKSNPDIEKMSFDTPVTFDISHLKNCLYNLSRETKDAGDANHVILADGTSKIFVNDNERFSFYADCVRNFEPVKTGKINRGTYADGSIDKFIRRINNRIDSDRLSFIFNKNHNNRTLKSVIESITGYKKQEESNVVIIDLSGVPFEVINTTISLLTRLLFDFSYKI
jgi:hypothetical protein